MDNGNFLEKLRADMLEQFRGKPNIEVLQSALARQLSDVYTFIEELNTRRWFDNAEGAQLDGIGNIVVMSRAEALAVSKKAGQTVPIDDDTYRLYLKWKNALNTTNCTHKDRHSALKMFWGKTPIYYSEDPAHPATIILTLPVSISESEEEIFDVATMIKAAGVGLRFVFKEPQISIIPVIGAVALDTVTTTVYPRSQDYVAPIQPTAHIGAAALVATTITIYPVEGS